MPTYLPKPLCLVTSVFLCFTFSATAQRSIDLFTLSGQMGPDNAYIEQPGTATEYTGLINLKVPVTFKNKKTIWYTNLTYTYSGVQPSVGFADSIASPLHLHGFILQTGLVQKLDDRHAIQILLAPRFMTDMKNVDGRSLQPGIVALFENEFNDHLLMRFGAMYNQDLFGPMLIPLVYLDWQPRSSKWSLSGLLPIYSKISYQVNSRFSAGIGHFGLVTSYALGGEGYAGDYMERKSIDITAFGRYRLVGNIHMEARIGMAMSRDYAQYAADDKLDFRVTVLEFGERNRKNVAFEDGFIANLRLVYNYPLK